MKCEARTQVHGGVKGSCDERVKLSSGKETVWQVGSFFFFFKQKTAYEIYQCDWSSDVCSSDLVVLEEMRLGRAASRLPAPRPIRIF